MLLPSTETACFVIADISGYTGFLHGVELDHAQDIIADLMDIVVKGLRPPFRLAKFEGDAAFVYAVTDKVDGSLLQDAIEAAYFAFRRRLRNIKQSTTCECNACRRMQTLDLKFVAHHGEFIKHKMAGREELAGAAVILIHRLLKNSVTDRFGPHAYALFSQGCVEAMVIDPQVQGLVEHHEEIDIIGNVTCWVRDLEEAWTMENERQRNEVTHDKAAMVLEYDLDAARPKVWEHFTVPGHRPKWQGSDGIVENAVNGRRGVGTKNHCMHGKDAIIEEIVDWRPFDYVTLDNQLPIPGSPKVLITYAFKEPGAGRTRVEVRVAKPKPKDRAFMEQMGPQFRQQVEMSMKALKLVLAGQADAPVVVEEPSIPVSAERFKTEPVHAHH